MYSECEDEVSQDILEEANMVLLNLLLLNYQLFKCWIETRQIRKMNEEVVLFYFSKKCVNLKPSTLRSKYSRLRSTLQIKGNIDIKFPKLVDFFKRNSAGYKAKKANTFSREDINKTTSILQNPDETYLHMKAREFDQYRQGFVYSMDTEHNCAGYSIYLIKDDNSDIEDILKPVETLELDSDGNYSDISDIFEEYHKDSFLRANADPSKKHLSKIEADCKTVDRFTDDFKKTMVALRKEQQITLPLFNEEESVEKVLNTSLEPRKSSTPPRRDSPIVIEQENDQRSETSSESLVWQRLLNNSDGRFKVTPPVYDVFRQEKKHWLERPPIPWKLVDNCRVKCDKWLDDVMRVGGE